MIRAVRQVGNLAVHVAICDRANDKPYVTGKCPWPWDGEKLFVLAIVQIPGRTDNAWIWEGWCSTEALALSAGACARKEDAEIFGELAQGAVDEMVQTGGRPAGNGRAS